MPDYLIYGKIIIDDIRLADGSVGRNILGGGGPQAALGARLWCDSIGFLSRSGTDIEDKHVQSLQKLKIDLTGWHRYPDIPTARNLLMDYDEDGYLLSRQHGPLMMTSSSEDWYRLLSQPLTLPGAYQHPRAIHLITEFHDEPMVDTALDLRRQGAIFSLEPLIDFVKWSNRDGLIRLLKQVDVVTPDWPSASGIAGSNDPVEVVKFWSGLGPDLIAVRNGANGSYVWDRHNDQIWHIPTLPVEVVDPTGAGNSYGGGLIIGWIEAQEARTAGCYGALSAKFLIERVGVPQMSASLQREARLLLEQALASARQL